MTELSRLAQPACSLEQGPANVDLLFLSQPFRGTGPNLTPLFNLLHHMEIFLVALTVQLSASSC